MTLIKILNHNETKSFVIFFLIFIFHLLFINLYPINDEFIFPVGAKLLERSNINEISLFFNFNANTLGFSLLIYFLSKLLPLDFYILGKILSCSGLILIYLSTHALIKIFNLNILKEKHMLILLILLNPLIFIFSFRATPDLFSSALSLFSITYFIINKNFFLKLFLIILFSFAVIIKPFNAILIFLIFISFNFKDFLSKKNFNLLIWSLVSFLIPTFYFFFNYQFFEFVFIPNEFRLIKIFSLKRYLINFISYVGFFNLFLILIYSKSFFNSFKKNYFYFLIYILISILCTFFLMQNVGELNFGFVQDYLNPRIYFFIITLSFFLFFHFIINNYNDNKFSRYHLNIIFLIIIFLIILSNFHPSQRYLLTIMPLGLFLFFLSSNIKILNILTVAVYIVMNILLFTNHYYTSKSIENIIVYLQENQILHDTYPGFIGQHSLNFFIDFDKNILISMDKEFLLDEQKNEKKKYYVSEKKPSDDKNIVFYTETKNIFKKNRNLYLIKK